MELSKEHRFLLFSSNNEETAEILKKFPKREGYKIEIVDNLKDVFDRAAGGMAHYFLFNVIECEANAIRVANRIQQASKNASKLWVIILASKIHQDAIKTIKQSTNMVTLEKPLGEIELDKICIKLANGQNLSQREHKRFMTRQTAVIEKLNTGEKLPSAVFNISRSGAYFELPEGKVSKGDVLKMTVQLEKLSKAHTMHAEVIWTVAEGHGRGQPGVGVKFMNAVDVYTTLLERI
jgi:response regulator RpfG family c-di-GMP phosphodiesterase